VNVEQKSFVDIFAQRELYTLIDVRSPSEFARGHIPGACNIPLFSDDVRALVGACYVQQGREPAMHLAMQKIAPNLDYLITQAQQVRRNKILCVYCARGGMRSASISWLYALFKLPVIQLHGGYKSFRNWVLQQFNSTQKVQILGGKTGSGKTEYLKFLAYTGEQVIDLEALARHRGSVFGGDKGNQATQQQFENDLALQLAGLDSVRIVWLEDESRKIGSIIIPEPIWLNMQRAPLYFLHAKRQERITRVMREYGNLDKDFLLSALAEIKEHLGLACYYDIKCALEQNELIYVIDQLLMYYDKKYVYGLSRKTIARCFVPLYLCPPLKNISFEHAYSK
jgi:tRNA 2-selenouridine synthase